VTPLIVPMIENLDEIEAEDRSFVTICRQPEYLHATSVALYDAVNIEMIERSMEMHQWGYSEFCCFPEAGHVVNVSEIAGLRASCY
jgi:hypothetical protein